MTRFHLSDSAERGGSAAGALATLDARVKLVSALCLTLWIGLLPAESAGLIGLLALGVVVLGALADLAPFRLLGRAAIVLPFVLLPAALGLLAGTLEPRAVAVMAARSYGAATVGALLIGVTPFPALLGAASALHAPDLLVQTTALTYRYLHVLRGRAAAMMASARARGFGPGTPRRFAVGGNMVGALLLHSLDRSERVHRAMLARGYTGRFPTAQALVMRPVDWVVGAIVPVCVAASLLCLR